MASDPRITGMPKGAVELTSSIDMTGTMCLNELKSNPHQNLWNPDARFTLKSDADEQLLLTVPFKDAVKIQAIVLQAPEGEFQPTSVKIFANRPPLGFDDAEDTEPTQVVELDPLALTAGTPIELRFVKFQRVNTLQLLFDNETSDEHTEIAAIEFYGVPIAGTNMSELKKAG